MSTPVLTSGSATPERAANASHQLGFKPSPAVKLVSAIGIMVICLAALLASRVWPFSEQSILEDLAKASDSQVSARGFRRTYFPSPGCVLEGLTFRHGPDDFALITIKRVTIVGSYFGILRQHVPRIIAEGGHVFIPPFGSNEVFHSQHSNIVVEEIVANGTVVEFASRDSKKPPLRFEIQEASFRDVRWGSPFAYHLRFHNPEPPGEITSNGKFGAWTTGTPGDTPISGTYTFQQADLGVYGGIAGTLDSQGKFDGVLQHLAIESTTNTPDFEVTSGGHKIKLKTRFNAYVDATRGNTFLNSVNAQLGHISLNAQGSVANVEGKKGKYARIDLAACQGRIEDILGLFVTGRSPMSGAVTLKARAEIPPADEPFLEKVRLQGMFGIENGTFSKAETQQNLDTLSAGARGQNKDDPETVLTDLKGQVVLSNGIASFSHISFSVPGAAARMHGTYSILNHKIDLHGTMRVDTKISRTSGGVKALLLKVMDPFFKKKRRGEIVPIHIAGTYEHPEFGLDLAKSDDHNHRQK